MRNLVLTGFMGTGKTSVGRAVALRLGRPFVDMDEEIEVRTGKPSRASLPKMGKLRFGLWRRRFAVSWALAGESWWRLGVVLLSTQSIGRASLRLRRWSACRRVR